MPIMLQVGHWMAKGLQAVGAWSVLDWFESDEEIYGPVTNDNFDYAKLGLVGILGIYGIYAFSKKPKRYKRY